MEEIKFALDTFYAVMAGALVMWMAAGFTMLEAGLVQKKDVSEIVTKNIGLYSIACIMYLACGFVIMSWGRPLTPLLFSSTVAQCTALATDTANFGTTDVAPTTSSGGPPATAAATRPNQHGRGLHCRIADCGS